MAEVIQFNCPACGTMLRLPLALAAQQGPCPNCDRKIVAPDPARGIAAFELPVPPPPKAIEPFQAFAESPPVVPSEPVRVTAPQQAVMPVAAKPQRAILVLSCLLTAALALAAGFALGIFSNQRFMELPPLAPLVIRPPKTEAPVAVTKPPEALPVPEPVKPVIEAVKIEKPEPPIKVSAAAEASLRAFLDAPDWAARNAYVLFPEKVREAMEAYSREVPDGPTVYKSVSVKQSNIDEKTGTTLLIFYVTTEMFPTGIPVAVKETSRGWLIDWQSFVEFRDNQFQQFVAGPADQIGHFHLVVSTPPAERASNTENEHFSSFLLQSPLAAARQLAFVKKPSELFDTFQTATAAGGMFTPVLEVTKHKTVEGQSYLEVTKLIATDWFPREE